VIREEEIESAIASIKDVETSLSDIKNAHTIKSQLSKARRALAKTQDRDKATGELIKGIEILDEEVTWRNRAQSEYLPGLMSFDAVVKHNIGLRLQARLAEDQAEAIASCLSHHRDISLAF
ncbi:MAG: C4-dicarboxylate ABC transporter permease, partial [Gammaproteobacteria bacterium]|nr:C4-dicarboxylate ABC transporter permease [Gammaproteobacteria bacterium]